MWCHCGELTTKLNKSSDPPETVRIRIDGTDLLGSNRVSAMDPRSPISKPIRRWYECNAYTLRGADHHADAPLLESL